MKGKRGVSEIITTVLIILLVLAAIVIVWQAVKGTIEAGTGTLTGQTACMGVDLSIGIVNASTDKVPIIRNTGGDAAAITPVILVKGEDKTTTFTCTPKTTLLQLESTVCSSITTDIIINDEVIVGAKMGTGTSAVTCPVTVKTKAV